MTAMAFLKNPALFDEILADFETIGYTGEEMNKLLCYVAAISRHDGQSLVGDDPVPDRRGKSFLQDTVLSLIPEECYEKYTRLTDQVLFYKDSDSLAHKILAIEEFDGMNRARSIPSAASSRPGRSPSPIPARTRPRARCGPARTRCKGH